MVLFATKAVGIGHNLFQSEHSKQRNREFRNNENARNCTELIVHGHIIEEEVRESHEILTP